MAILTNGIATRGDCNTVAPDSFSSNLTKCPTKSEILAAGTLKLTGGDYLDEQSVRFSDIAADYFLSISPSSSTVAIGGGSFTITVASNATWQVTYPSWCSGTISENKITVTVASNAGSASRNGSITVRTTTGETITQYCSIKQDGLPVYGGEINVGILFSNRFTYTLSFRGRTEVTIGGTYLGSFDINGNIQPGNTEDINVGNGFFNYSSFDKTVPVSLKIIIDSGDMGAGGLSFNVSGDATGDYGGGSFIEKDGQGSFNLSFIQTGDGNNCRIYARCVTFGTT